MERYQYSVLSMAQELAAAATGSGDVPSNVGERVAWLKWRVEEGWEPSRITPGYDDSVRSFAREALAVWEARAKTPDPPSPEEFPEPTPEELAAAAPYEEVEGDGLAWSGPWCEECCGDGFLYPNDDLEDGVECPLCGDRGVFERAKAGDPVRSGSWTATYEGPGSWGLSRLPTEKTPGTENLGSFLARGGVVEMSLRDGHRLIFESRYAGKAFLELVERLGRFSELEAGGGGG